MNAPLQYDSQVFGLGKDAKRLQKDKQLSSQTGDEDSPSDVPPFHDFVRRSGIEGPPPSQLSVLEEQRHDGPERGKNGAKTISVFQVHTKPTCTLCQGCRWPWLARPVSWAWDVSTNLKSSYDFNLLYMESMTFVYVPRS
jgi:hypothetical protein